MPSDAEILAILTGAKKPKPPFPGSAPDHVADSAAQLWDMFTAFQEVGFTRDEAIQLVCEILRAGIDR